MTSRKGNASPYDGLAKRYDRARPSYPPESIACVKVEDGDIVVDVGAGTGIFTRQLALALSEARVVGIEASEDMHREAERSSAGIANVSFVRGRAEVLPFDDKSVRMITVATAIHWFDRPAFYAEATRCLRLDGELLALQNIRRWWENEFLADYESIHEGAVEGYRRGSYPARHGGFDEIDVGVELRKRPGFRDVQVNDVLWSHLIRSDEFIELSLTSSITQRAISTMGEQAYLQALGRLLEQHAGPTGAVEMSYLTRATSAKPSVHARQ
jgi:SAM-dependent methyltransferase